MQEMRAPGSLQLLKWQFWSFSLVSGNGRMGGAAFPCLCFRQPFLTDRGCEVRIVNKRIKSRMCPTGRDWSQYWQTQISILCSFFKSGSCKSNPVPWPSVLWQFNKCTELGAAQAVRWGEERLWMRKLQQCLSLESWSYNNDICHSVLEMGLHFQLIQISFTKISFTKISIYQCSQTSPPIYGA